MIIYNVTVKIEASAHDDWLQWMKETHIPDVMKTGCFAENKIMRMIDPPADRQGITYAIQYFCENVGTLRDYWEKHAPPLQAEHTERYEGKFVAFRTVLREV